MLRTLLRQRYERGDSRNLINPRPGDWLELGNDAFGGIGICTGEIPFCSILVVGQHLKLLTSASSGRLFVAVSSD